MALATLPLIDNYSTVLSQSRNGAVGTIYVNTVPTFTFPAWVTTYIVVDPGKSNMQVAKISAYDATLKTITVSSVTVDKGNWVAYTAQSHSVGAKVRISDNYQFRADIKTNMDLKVTTNSANTDTGSFADATARDAYFSSPANGMSAYLVSPGKRTDRVAWSWTDRATNVNASTTTAWAVEISTQAEQSAGTDTGWSWASLVSTPSVINATIAFNTWTNQANNYTISASRSASAETISLKTLAWSDPTATDPIKIAFRISTASSGGYQVRTISSAMSITIPSTATIGMTNNLPARLWLVAFDDDSGTVKLWIINTQVTWGIFPLQDDILASATTIDTSSDSAWVFYVSSGFSTKPYRILGYLEYTLATVGTRGTAPSKIQLFWPWVKKPGDTVQTVSNYTGAVATWTTTIPYDDTIPQITEWDQYMTQAITPISAINRLSINIVANWSQNWSLNTTLALFQDATAWALACIAEWVVAATPVEMFPLILDHFMVAWTTSATTMRARVGISWSWTYTFNGAATARKFGWVMSSWMKITEIMV